MINLGELNRITPQGTMADLNFTQAECFQVDPQGKSVLIVYYPENIDPERLENLQEGVNHIQSDLDRWAKEPDSHVYVLCLPWDVRIKIEKVALDND